MLPAGAEFHLADTDFSVGIPVAGAFDFECNALGAALQNKGIAGAGIVAGILNVDLVRSSPRGLHRPDGVVIVGCPPTEVSVLAFERQFAAKDFAGFRQKLKLSVAGGKDDLRMVAFERSPLGGRPSRADERDQIGQILRRHASF